MVQRRKYGKRKKLKISKKVAGGIVMLATAAVILACFFYSQIATDEQPYVNIKVEYAKEFEEGESINVYDTQSGEIVNMNLEDYTFHVLAGEMFAEYDEEALKAQACAIRSYAIYKKQHGGCAANGGDICTDYHSCLAYLREDEFTSRFGEGKELEYENKLRKAVLDTKGQVIVCDGEVINAIFHSNSGGMTEDVKNVWGSDESYLKSVKSDEKEDSFKYSQDLTFTEDEIFEKLSDYGIDAQKGEIKVLSRFESGRVNEVMAGSATLKGTQMREALGLNSANFTITRTESGYDFYVLGYGHGVGLSQAGAQQMALEGYTYVEIIKHYYTGTDIKNITDL